MCSSNLLTIFGWFVAVLTGVGVAAYAERTRVLNGLRSRVMLIREDVELSMDKEWRDPEREGTIDRVWSQALRDLQQTVFAALPYLVLCGERDSVITAWRDLRDFDMQGFYQAGSIRENLDRNLYGVRTITQKQALLNALSRLEQRIG